MQHRTDRRTLPFTLKHSARWVATALCLALPVSAQALGVGQLQVRSALNQPLNAEVELLEVKPGDLDSLRVRIATQSLGGFEPSADMIDYRIESRDGRHFLRLTSGRAIREPLLNFLIELNWERGRLLREVAVFLDPPDPRRMPTLAEAPPAPPAPRTTAAPRQPAAAAPSPAPTAPITTGEGLSYGPVRRGETLWNIAQRTRPGPEVSMQQMMQAIYQANPQAFARANMDMLMAGATLRIPSVDGRTPRSATPPEPAPQVAVTPPRPQPEPPAPPPPAPEPVAELEPEPLSEPPRPADEVQVRLVPPPEAVVTPTAAPAVPRLRAEGEPFRLQAAGLDSLRERVRTLQNERPELLIARTEPEEVRAEPEDVVTPVPSPAEPTETPVTPEPDPIVSAETPPTPDEPAPEPEETVVIEAPAEAEPALDVEPAETLAVPEAAVEPTPAEPVSEPAAAESIPSETPVSDPPGSEPEDVALAPTEPTPTPEVSMPAVTAEPPPRPDVVVTDPPSPPAMSSGIDITGLLLQFQRDPVGTLSDLRREPIALPLLGGGLALLLLLGWLIRRAKRSGEEQAGVYDTPSPAAAGGPAVPSRTPPAAREVADGVGQEKARRLGRVDFLIAGGSYREAENLVRLIMVEEPDNPELQAKLLEVYYKSGDSDKFIETAAALKQQLGDDTLHHLWQKTRRMGNEISPGHPLFIDTDDDEDTVVFGPQGREDRAIAQAASDPDATVTQPRAPRLAFPGEAMPQTSESSRSELHQTENDTTQVVPEFTLSDLDRPSTKAVMADQQAAERRIDPGVDESEPLPDPAEWRSSPEMETPPKEENPFDDLFAAEPPQPPGADPQADDIRPVRETPEPGLGGLPEFGVEDETPFDEDDEAVEIKLDLAQAYLDMDDRMGARTLLDEVLREGNEAQQARAKSILKSMS